MLHTLPVITRTIHTSLFHGCQVRFAHLRLLLVQYTQACCRIVENASHTYGYYSYNTYKPVPRLLSTLRTLTVITRTIHTSLLYNFLRTLRTLTVITRAIHTSLFHDCCAHFAHFRLLLVQYTQACSTIFEHASHTYGYYSYNTHKPVPRLLRTLRTLTVITRTIHTSLLSNC